MLSRTCGLQSPKASLRVHLSIAAKASARKTQIVGAYERKLGVTLIARVAAWPLAGPAIEHLIQYLVLPVRVLLRIVRPSSCDHRRRYTSNILVVLSNKYLLTNYGFRRAP